VVRLTPEICYIDLAGAARKWSRAFLRFLSRGSRRRGTHLGSRARLKPDKGKAGEFSAYPSFHTGSCRYPLRENTRRAVTIV